MYYFERFFNSPYLLHHQEHIDPESVRTGCIIPDSDHPGTSSESDQESRDQEKNSASDLCAEFYFRYRTLWYGSYVSFTGRPDE